MRSCRACLCSHCGLLDNKAELGVLTVFFFKLLLLFFFDRTSSKPASSQSSYLLGFGSEGVRGRRQRGSWEREGARQMRVTARGVHQLTLNWANPISFTSSGISDPSQPEANLNVNVFKALGSSTIFCKLAATITTSWPSTKPAEKSS